MIGTSVMREFNIDNKWVKSNTKALITTVLNYDQKFKPN